jgi:hypothetical protein
MSLSLKSIVRARNALVDEKACYCVILTSASRALYGREQPHVWQRENFAGVVRGCRRTLFVLQIVVK